MTEKGAPLVQDVDAGLLRRGDDRGVKVEAHADQELDIGDRQIGITQTGGAGLEDLRVGDRDDGSPGRPVLHGLVGSNQLRFQGLIHDRVQVVAVVAVVLALASVLIRQAVAEDIGESKVVAADGDGGKFHAAGHLADLSSRLPGTRRGRQVGDGRAAAGDVLNSRVADTAIGGGELPAVRHRRPVTAVGRGIRIRIVGRVALARRVGVTQRRIVIVRPRDGSERGDGPGQIRADPPVLGLGVSVTFDSVTVAPGLRSNCPRSPHVFWPV
jgi:hypothetical protein